MVLLATACTSMSSVDHPCPARGSLQKWAQRFSQAEQSDGYKLLKEIHDADKSIDHIDKRDDDILHWKEVYESETAKWRRAVASCSAALTPP